MLGRVRQTAIALALAGATLAGGCQLIAGLSTLETVAGEPGGAGGAAGGGGAAGEAGMGGMPACTAATVVEDCGADSDCRSWSCEAGSCEPTDAVLGTSCQDGGEVCDGEGACVAASCVDTVQNNDETDVDCGGGCPGCPDDSDCLEHDDCESGYCNPADTCQATAPLGTVCTEDEACATGFCTDGHCCNVDSGDNSDTLCTNPDTCDGNGQCQSNHASNSTPCCENDNQIGMCNNGTCNATACAGNFKCEDSDSCHGGPCMPGECVDTHFCAPGGPQAGQCLGCDMEVPAPMPGTCTGQCAAGLPSSCTGETCVIDCIGPTNCMTSPIIANAAMYPVIVDCGAGCDGKTIECQGPHDCIINCTVGGLCENLTINCSQDQECILNCDDNACEGVMGVTMNCGDRKCIANCDGGENVDQNCGGACLCDPC